MSKYQKELDAAVAAVSLAARVCQSVQKTKNLDSTKLDKQDRSPVTIADFASQAVVCKVLQEVFADDPVVGEEDSAQLRLDESASIREQVIANVNAVLDSPVDEATILGWIDRGNADGSTKRYWTLDPIDGTKGFLRGEQYAIALALIEDGKVVAGVLGCPNLPGDESAQQVDVVPGAGVIMTAAADKPSEQQLIGDPGSTKPIRVADIAATGEARLCESVESGHSNQSDSAKIAKLLGIATEPARLDSQAKYGVVARGQASIYLRMPTRVDYREKIWDHAAGMIVTQMAGGKVTDVTGKALDYTHGPKLEENRGVVATNGTIHEKVIEAVQEVLNSQ